jgi:hypothetical protein
MAEHNATATNLSTYLDLRQRITNGHTDPKLIQEFTNVAARLAKLDPQLLQSILEHYLKQNGHKSV